MFGDGKGAMELMGEWLLSSQASNAADRQGPADRQYRLADLSDRARRPRARRPIHWAASTAGSSPRRAEDTVAFLKFFSEDKYQRVAGGDRRLYSRRHGTDSAIENPVVKQIAGQLAATTYHQNFFDQDLGPSVGRVVNDVSVAVAAGEMKPEAAAAIQDAWTSSRLGASPPPCGGGRTAPPLHMAYEWTRRPHFKAGGEARHWR